MASKMKKSSSASPYTKRDKCSYAYSFKRCSHTNTVRQSVPGWQGVVCASCNTIVGKDEREYVR